MSWYLRAVEQPDGWWICRHGQTVLGAHSTLTAALDHLREHGATELEGPIEFLVHYLDGRVVAHEP